MSQEETTPAPVQTNYDKEIALLREQNKQLQETLNEFIKTTKEVMVKKEEPVVLHPSDEEIINREDVRIRVQRHHKSPEDANNEFLQLMQFMNENKSLVNDFSITGGIPGRAHQAKLLFDKGLISSLQDFEKAERAAALRERGLW